MARKTFEYITETATDAAGMNKKDTLAFHFCNPNGLVKKLPEFEDFCHGDTFFTGCEMLYSQHSNFHARWIRDNLMKRSPRFTRWEMNYHITELAKDIDKAWAALAEKKAAA